MTKFQWAIASRKISLSLSQIRVEWGGCSLCLTLYSADTHWEDPGEYGSETISGSVTISQAKIGGDISYMSVSDALSKFDVTT